MNQEIRNMIGSALHDEPPLGIDRERMLRTGRRRVRLRRAGVTAGAALGVVAAVLTAVTVTGRHVPDDEIVAGATSTGSAAPATKAPAGAACNGRPASPGAPPASGPPSGAPGDPAGGPPATSDPGALAEAARLSEGFGRVLFPWPAGERAPEVVFCATGESWQTNFPLRASTGERAVYIEVRPRGAAKPGECSTFGGAAQCRTATLPDGTAFRVDDTPSPGSDLPAIHSVTAWRPDRTIVSVMETGSQAPAGQRSAPRVLSEEALIKIATAPELKTGWTGPVVAQPAEPSDRRARELSAALARANVLPPGMRAAPVPGSRTDPMEFYGSQGGYKLNADLLDAAGEGDLFISLYSGASGTVSCGDYTGGDCTTRQLPDGNTAVMVTYRDQPVPGAIMRTVAVSRPDGTSISVGVTNVSNRAKDTGEKNPPPLRGPTRPEPPLDVEILIRIVSLPDLHW